MDPQIVSAIITSVTTFVVSGIGFLVIRLLLNNQQARISKELERIKPALSPKFENDNSFIILVDKIKEEFLNFYYYHPRDLLKRFTFFEHTFRDQDPESVSVYFDDDFEYKIYEELSSSGCSEFYSVYSGIASLHDANIFFRSTIKKNNDFLSTHKLIDKELKEMGTIFIQSFVNFYFSPEFQNLLKRLQIIRHDNEASYKIFDEFWKEQVEIIQNGYSKIEERFSHLYCE